MSKSLTVPTESVQLGNPAQLIEFATTLKQFIVEQKLFTNIKGKNYVEVEGWQFAGAATGTVPIVVSVEQIPTDSFIDAEKKKPEIKYRAEVELRRVIDDQKIGYGVAICSNKESKKVTFDEYAVASMAQTRATGKAYRNTFAWLMKIAGYEATPAEEADEIKVKKDNLSDDQKAAIKNEAAEIAANLKKQETAGAEPQEHPKDEVFNPEAADDGKEAPSTDNA